MEHTKLPWHVECFDEDDIINIRARPEKGLTTHIVYMDYNDEETQANAEFIVKACNNHYQLLDALKKIRDVDGNIPTEHAAALFASLNRAAREAIKAAEEE